MAISRAQLLAELLPALNDLFGTEYEGGWAVHHKERDILKVEPWDSHKHMRTKSRKRAVRPGIIHVNSARDEIDAYMQAQRTLEGKYK